MEGKKFKRLFFDIETSPNVVFSWNIGHDVRIDHNNIIKERAIICICYKYEHEKTVHALTWDKGDDKAMIEKFAEIMNSADEVVGHNSDSFDIKWVRARAALHGISIAPDLVTLDTLRMARGKFRFNSNKLDYLGQYFGLGSKLPTGFALWKSIVMDNDPKAMATMVRYCKQDVRLLEDVYHKLTPYTINKSDVASIEGKHGLNCPECTSSSVVASGTRLLVGGLRKHRYQCKACGKYFSLSTTALNSKTKNE